MAFPDDFTVELRRSDRSLLVVPAGELDVATVPKLAAALLEHVEPGQPVALDLRGLEFIDTAGLRLVLEQHERVKADGGRLVLVRGSASVQRLFEIAGLAEVLEFVDDPDQLHTDNGGAPEP
ncbi:MAG: STAS domain-containing protein [Thermoleophilaceae bacterium]